MNAPETIDEITTKEPYLIGKEFIENNKTKHSRLINNNSEGFTLAPGNKWLEFKLEEPIYCMSITVKVTNSNMTGLNLSCKNNYRNIYNHRVVGDLNHIKFTINSAITSFQVLPPKRYGKKIELESITITGYSEKDFDKITIAANQYVKINDNLESKKQSNQQLQEETEEKLEALNESIDSSQVTLNELKSDISERSIELTHIKDELRDQKSDSIAAEGGLKLIQASASQEKNRKEQLESECSSLNDNISKARRELQSAEKDQSLLAYEVKEYVKQGNRNKETYILLSFVPWLIIGYISLNLFSSAINLIPAADKNINIIDVLLSRLPFTLIAGVIVIAAYEISKIFATKVIEINAQKLRFSEIGIIAKDVSESSLEGLDVEDKDAADIKTRLKMDLLRHHLKNLDPEKFEYDINPSLWSHYSNFLTRDIKKAIVPKTDERLEE